MSTGDIMDAGPMVEISPGTWIRSGVLIQVTDPVTGAPSQCPRCGSNVWTVQPDGRLKSGCGLLGRAA